MLKRFNREEQGKLEGAVEAMEGLKSKVKKEMALIKVVDLLKRNSTISEEQQKGDSEEGVKVAEKINYMIVKAKVQVNSAFDVLFAKDSSLNKAKGLNDLPLIPRTTKVGSEQVPIGTLRVTGLTLPKVIKLGESSLKDLRSNLTVFAH